MVEYQVFYSNRRLFNSGIPNSNDKVGVQGRKLVPISDTGRLNGQESTSGAFMGATQARFQWEGRQYFAMLLFTYRDVVTDFPEASAGASICQTWKDVRPKKGTIPMWRLLRRTWCRNPLMHGAKKWSEAILWRPALATAVHGPRSAFPFSSYPFHFL